MKALGLSLISALWIMGCSGGPAIQVKNAAFNLPAGWTKGMSDDQIVTIAIPTGWRQGVDRMPTVTDMFGGGNDPASGGDPGSGGSIDLNSQAGGNPQAQDVANTLNQMKEASEKESAEMERRELEELKKKGIILNVISSGKPTIGETRTRFFVKKSSQGANWDWDQAHASEREKYLHKPVAAEIDLPIGKAHRMMETRQLIDGANYTIISYLIIHGKDLYTLRFLTEEQASIVTSIEKEVANSLRIQP
jgi:hypothetical protein